MNTMFSPDFLNLLVTLRADKANHSLCCTYNGYGDDGDVENVALVRKKGKDQKLSPKERELISNTMWDIISSHFGGFENNEGGSGEVTIFLQKGTIEIEHTDYSMENDEDTTTLTARLGPNPGDDPDILDIENVIPYLQKHRITSLSVSFYSSGGEATIHLIKLHARKKLTQRVTDQVERLLTEPLTQFLAVAFEDDLGSEHGCEGDIKIVLRSRKVTGSSRCYDRVETSASARENFGSEIKELEAATKGLKKAKATQLKLPPSGQPAMVSTLDLV